uniref:Chromosome 1 open reading frame 115 n=1 Tax=Microcebus murinus TaxID=30608 RepID=A0A8C5XQI5_MICMU
MTVGTRLRSKAAPRRGPRVRGRAEGDEEAAPILEHLECGDLEHPECGDLEHPECGDRAARGRRAGGRSARKVHLAVLPERYEPLEEPAPGDKPKRRYRQKLKKYGKVGDARYVASALQGFAAAYAAARSRWPTSVVSFVR